MPPHAGSTDESTDGAAAGSATAEAVMRAARDLFARHGYDGASIRAITGAAGANLGAVTYHFGSKRELYGRVLASVLGPLARKIADAAARADPPPVRIEAVMRAFFDHFSRNPDMPRLMLQEITAGRRPPDEVARMIRTALRALTGVIVEGQADGTIRDGDPLFMALSVVAQPVYLTLIGPFVRTVVGLDPSDPSTRQAMVDHAVRFAWAGLAADEGGTP